MPGRLFTSESVTEGHPDKIADQISDGVLDAVLADDPYGRVACETLITTGQVMVAGEISTSTYVDIPQIVRSTIRRIGYDRAKYGFDCETCGVSVALGDGLRGEEMALSHAARPPNDWRIDGEHSEKPGPAGAAAGRRNR